MAKHFVYDNLSELLQDLAGDLCWYGGKYHIFVVNCCLGVACCAQIFATLKLVFTRDPFSIYWPLKIHMISMGFLQDHE